MLPKLVFALGAAALLASCTSTPWRIPEGRGGNTGGGRYELERDSGAIEPIDLAQVRPVVPRRETRTSAGNKSPYSINGQTYNVLSSEAGYSEVGMASWYGRKFHGYRTSNGEVYDMFQLSAAHPVLPIPSYARVTNLDNGKSIVVRINDRGPFHPDRIIDLSYAGATMLGYAGQGTARVKVEAIVPEEGAMPSPPVQVATAPVMQDNEVETVAAERLRIERGEGNEYLQVGAFANLESARSLVARLSEMTPMEVFIQTDAAAGLHKVRVGPVRDEALARELVNSLESARLGTPFRVRI